MHYSTVNCYLRSWVWLRGRAPGSGRLLIPGPCTEDRVIVGQNIISNKLKVSLDAFWCIWTDSFCIVLYSFFSFGGGGVGGATCLFTRLVSLARFQKGFWKLSFCRNCDLWSLCFDRENRDMLLFIAFLQEWECVEKLGRMKNGLVSTFPFLHASNAEKPHFSSHISANAGGGERVTNHSIVIFAGWV